MSTSHHAKVDRIERDHRQNACEKAHDLQPDGQHRRQQAGRRTGDRSERRRKKRVHTADDRDRGRRPAQREAAVDGQVRKVQQAEGDIDAHRDQPENKARFERP